MKKRQLDLLRSLWLAQNREPRWWIHPAAIREPGYADTRRALDGLAAKRWVERKARFLPRQGQQVFYYRLSETGRALLAERGESKHLDFLPRSTDR